MPVLPQTETYHFTGALARCLTQSIVECRLSAAAQSDVATVLAVRATAVLTDARAADGEIRYGGKLLLCLVYENAEKSVCRMERGVEFSHFVRDDNIVPACTPFVQLQVLATTLRREGASLYASCVVEADVTARGDRSLTYLNGGEGVVCQKQPVTLCNELYCGGETELSDEFESEYVTDILLHDEFVSVQKVTPTSGGLLLSGEIAVNICALKQDGVVNFERLLPFRVELPCDGATTDDRAEGFVNVISAQIDLTTDEEKGKSKTACTVRLSLHGVLYRLTDRLVATDAFSPTNRLDLLQADSSYQYCAQTTSFTERVFGVASLSEKIDHSCALQALTLPKAECEPVQNELQGVASAVLFVLDSDGSHRGVGVQLPFVIPFNSDMGGTCKVTALVCGMSAHQKREGELEVEATVKVTVSTLQTAELTFLQGATVGEECKPKDCAFSVFLPAEGASLWDIAKALKKPPQEVQAENPTLTFPVPAGERIIVYRQKE